MKQQLVDAIRMLERAAIIDHNGHCSARRDANAFYINSGASVRGALTVDDIVTVDLDGNLVEGSARPPLEFHIHSEVYRARPDVNAVMHTHPQWSTFLTMVGAPFKPVYAQGVLLGDIPLMDSPLSVNTKADGREARGDARPRPGGAAQGSRRRRRRRRHRRMLRAGRVRRGERVPPVHGDADRRAVRLQRSGAAGLPGEAVVAEPVQEDLGPLLLEDL